MKSKNIENRPTPLQEINTKKYLNDVSIKYRYDLIKLSKISEKLGHNDKIQHENLFKRLGHKGHNIDKDIKLAMQHLHSIKKSKLIEGNNLTKKNDFKIFNQSNNSNNFRTLNKTVERPKIEYIPLVNARTTYSDDEDDSNNDIEKEIESEEENNASASDVKNIKFATISNISANINKAKKQLKGVQIRLVNHNKKFSVFSKNKLDFSIIEEEEDKSKPNLLQSPAHRQSNSIVISRLDSIKKKKNIFGKKIKESKKKSILTPIGLNENELRENTIQNNSIDYSNVFNTLSNTKTITIDDNFPPEYDKIKYENSGNVELIKNYLVPIPYNKTNIPVINFQDNSNTLNSNTRKHNRNKTITGKVSLNQLLKDDELTQNETQNNLNKNYKLVLVKSPSGEVVYTVVKNKSKTKRKNAAYSMGMLESNKIILPIINSPNTNTNNVDLEKEYLNILKKKNLEKANKYRIDSDMKFQTEVEKGRQKMFSLEVEIVNTLDRAARKYDKNQFRGKNQI
jgi:hypothetical protein